MVNFGDLLAKSKRPGWENAYLDYEGLKDVGRRVRRLLAERERHLTGDPTQDSTITSARLEEDLHRYSALFTAKLHQEIEKVTLFCLAMLGDLAHSLGALRFDESQLLACAAKHDAVETCERCDSALDEIEHVDEKQQEFTPDSLGELTRLLPSSRTGSYVSESRRNSRQPFGKLFKKENLFTLVGRDFDDAEDGVRIYSVVGVELLHLLRFTCLNAVGIRKIVKKYEKAFIEFPLVTGESLHDTVALNENSSYDRLLSLSNDQSFSVIYASLQDALTEAQNAILTSTGLSKNLLDSFLRSKTMTRKFKDGNELLRLECTVSSIQAIRDFARDVSKPFQVFLSRKAMIGAGKDRGEIGSANKKAIDVLVLFEPDFILDMSDAELHEWWLRLTKKPTLHEYASIDNPFLTVQDRYWGGVDRPSMVINLLSILLYTINYYIISPTANHYAILLGTSGEFGATLIGASSFAALFSAFLYSVWYTRASFRSALFFSALCPFVGNLLYSLALTYKSMKLALFGRALCGFGSAEVINRQLISACVSVQGMTRASALFVTASAIGMGIGPLIAAILDMTAGRDTQDDILIHLPWSPVDSAIALNNVTMPGFLMAFFWGLLLIGLVFLFDEPLRINTGDEMQTEKNRLKEHNGPSKTGHTNACLALIHVIFSNPAFLVTLFLFGFIELSGEVLISSCSMVIHRYFRWNGSSAGLIIASLGALVLPAHFIVERASRYYSERMILQWSMLVIMFSLVSISNLEGLFLDAIGLIVDSTDSRSFFIKHLRQVVKQESKHGEFPYDWGAGVYVYIISLSLLFISTIVMEGVNTSLMSKTTPRALNDTFINMGLLATLVGTFGRVAGDSMIVACAFFSRSPLHDFVSVTFLPMLPIIGFGWFMMKKHWKLLV